MAEEWRRGEFTISTERARLDLEVVHRFLHDESYWAAGRAAEVVRRAIENSLPFGLYEGARQIGFARVVTDYATFAWLADVFVLAEFRGLGLGKWLVETVVNCAALRDLRRLTLVTRDAHGLYRQFGFTEPPPDAYMERLNPQAGPRPPLSTETT